MAAVLVVVNRSGLYTNFFSPINMAGLLVVGTYHFINFEPFYIPLIYYILIVSFFLTLYISCQQSSRSAYETIANQYKSAAYLAIWLFVLGFLNFMIRTSFSIIVSNTGFNQTFTPFILALIAIASILAIWASSLFIVLIINSDGSIKSAIHSLLRAVKTVFYALPFCILIGAIIIALHVSMLILSQLISQLSQGAINYGLLGIILELLVTMPLLACVTTTFYNTIYKTLK